MNALLGGNKQSGNHGTSSNNLSGLANQVFSGLTHSGSGSHGTSASHGSSSGGGLGGKLVGQLAQNLFSSGSKPQGQAQNYHSGQQTTQPNSGGLAGSMMGGVAHMFGGQSHSSVRCVAFPSRQTNQACPQRADLDRTKTTGTRMPVKQEDTVARRRQHPTSHQECLSTNQLLNILLKARSRPRRTTLPPRMPNRTRHLLTKHRHSSLRTLTARHHSSTARLASHHRRLINTREATKATQVPPNIRNTLNTGRYQALPRDSPLHISTDTSKVNMVRLSMAEDMGSNNHHRTVDSKGDTLLINRHPRASIPLNHPTAKVHLCSMEVILDMEATRNTKGGIRMPMINSE